MDRATKKQTRVNGKKRPKSKREVPRHTTNKKYNVGEEERLRKKLKQPLVAADRRLPGYPNLSFLVLVQPSTLHHGGHDLQGLGGVDRNVVQKFGNG